MRIAVTAAGPELTSAVDQRFGRARYLIVVDTPERWSTALVSSGPAAVTAILM